MNLTVRACFNPSSIRARVSSPALQGGVGGVSLESKIKRIAEKAAIPPKINCNCGIGIPPSSKMGGSTIPTPVPTRLESVIMPTAVARSSFENHLAGTVVQAFNRNGWAAAIPIVLPKRGHNYLQPNLAGCRKLP